MKLPNFNNFKFPGLPSLPGIPTLPNIKMPEINLPSDPTSVVIYMGIILIAYIIFKKIFRFIALMGLILLVMFIASSSQ